MKIVSWNINSVRLRIAQVGRFLTEQAPDVLCLQEIKVRADLFPREAFARLGYVHQLIPGQKGYHGVATVSRLPLREIARHDWQDNGEARHVGVEVLGAGQGLIVENVYIPAGGAVPDRATNPKFAQKLDFLGRMTRWADALDRYYAEHDDILTGGAARSPRLVTIDETDASSGVWRVEQTIDDPAGDHDWRIRAEVDLDASAEEGAAVVRVTEVVRL